MCSSSVRTGAATWSRACRCSPNWRTKSDTLNVRIFLRDQNEDLMNQYLKEGQFKSIPVVVFFDQQMRELGHFIERPAAQTAESAAARNAFFAAHPEFNAAGERRFRRTHPRGAAGLGRREHQIARRAGIGMESVARGRVEEAREQRSRVTNYRVSSTEY